MTAIKNTKDVSSDHAANVFVIVFFIAIAVLLFSVAMGGHDHDEDHYMLGARLFADHTIYKDYLYQQPPLHAAVLGSFYEFFANMFGVCERHCYFLIARLVNLVFALGVIAVFYLLLRTMFERSVAIVACTLLTFTYSFHAATSVSRNDLMPLFLSLLAVLVLFRPSAIGALGKWQALVAGLCAALAVGTKLNYLHMPLALLLFMALWPPQRTMGERLREQVMPFSFGGLIGVGSIALFAAHDLTAFYFGAYQFHSRPPPEWVAANQAQFAAHTPLRTLADMLMRTPTSVLIVLSGFLMLLIGSGNAGKRPFAYFYRNGQWLFFLIVLIGIPLCLLPAPSYKWYFLPVAPFLILCFASLWSFPMRYDLVRYVALGIAVLACIPNFVSIASKYLPLLSDRQRWQPAIVHAASVRLDEILDAAQVPGKIATLSPSRIIDTKRDFYPEFATAWGLFSRAAFMPNDEVRRLHGASPGTLSRLFDADLPAAIFGGYEKNNGDPALFAFAEAHGYRRVEDPALGRGILFVRQATVYKEQ